MRFVVLFALALSLLASPASAFGPRAPHWRTHTQKITNADGSTTVVTVETPLFLPRVRQPRISTKHIPAGAATAAK